MRRFRPRLPRILRLRRRAALAASVLLAVAAGAPAAAQGSDESLFADLPASSGLDFVHFNGMTGELYFPEMTGQGGALLDYDRDGDLDLYLLQGHLLGPGKTLADAVLPPPAGFAPGDRLLRNDLAAGENGSPRFVDVTAEAGIVADGYAMGVAVGDVDGDGYPDLYLANFGSNQLLRNRGDGTFEDVTAASGTADPAWTVTATFFDADGDGDQDLYVVNYVEFTFDSGVTCFATSSRVDYCGPAAFPPAPDRFYRNRGDGNFEEATVAAGLGRVAGPGLGVVAADFTGDGRPDLYVANDGAANFLWTNRGDGTFEDEALLAGAAVNRRGRPEASMGVDAADFDDDGDLDLFLAHLAMESNTLYVNLGGGLFEDRSIEAGLAAGSLPYTAFGALWIDVDNDGRLDLAVVNGAVKILEERVQAGDLFPLDQPNQLFRATGSGAFEEVSARAGDAFTDEEVSRGLAAGDVDNDGDVDLLLTNNNGPARLLVNQVGQRAPWLGLDLGEVGAEARIARRDASPLLRRAKTDGSYASAGDPRITAGLGTAAPLAVDLAWPAAPRAGRADKIRRRWTAPVAGAYALWRAPRAAAAAPTTGTAPPNDEEPDRETDE